MKTINEMIREKRNELCRKLAALDETLKTMPPSPLKTYIEQRAKAHRQWPVSYTHLTLPTIYSV